MPISGPRRPGCMPARSCAKRSTFDVEAQGGFDVHRFECDRAVVLAAVLARLFALHPRAELFFAFELLELFDGFGVRGLTVARVGSAAFVALVVDAALDDHRECIESFCHAGSFVAKMHLLYTHAAVFVHRSSIRPGFLWGAGNRQQMGRGVEQPVGTRQIFGPIEERQCIGMACVA